MHELPEGETICPFCKYDGVTPNNENYLPIKTVLQQRYVVGKVLSVNGEGVTYIGFDRELNMPVRIREYYPANVCERCGEIVTANDEQANIYKAELNEFFKLARNLARMRSLSAILPVYDIFEANNTAYYISETVESITLRDFLIRNGGSLSFDQLRPLFMPIMQSLASLHQIGVIHRGISPDTLIIGKDGKVRLTEFAISAARTARSPLTAQLFKGYAAIEQYGIDNEQGPWTDVYALAATMYRALVGSPPPEATARVTNDKMIIPANVADNLSAYVMSGLANALQILPNERTESIETFRDEISATPTVVTKAEQRSQRAESDRSNAQRTSKNKRGVYVIVSMIITIVALSLVGLFVYFGFINKDNSDTTQTTTIAQTTTIPYSENIIDPDVGTVPNLAGMSYAEIIDSTDTEIMQAVDNYKIVVKSKEYNDKIDEDDVISQSPKAGQSIKKGDTIELVVSLGEREFKMPDIVGLTKDKAHIKLLIAGFKDDNITWVEKSFANKKANSVISVTPDEGDSVNSDMKVTVSINIYEEPETTKAVITESSNDSTQANADDTNQ